MNLLTVSGIHKTINETWALQNISFTLNRYQKWAITGETGSGKSTLLKIIAGLVQPDTGNVYFENERVKGPDEVLVPGHPGIAYLSQHFELRNNYRVADMLDYANRLSQRKAGELFRLCRIDHLMKRKTDQLSGGEKQRIALARLLVSAPKLLLLDEPFSNLDMIHKVHLESVLNDLSEKLKITIVFVAHDPSDILAKAEKVMVLKSGICVQEGPVGEVYHHPLDTYTAAILGEYNLIGDALWAELTGNPDHAGNGKRSFIRPGEISITRDSETARGKITGIIQKDGYKDITVTFTKGSVLVRSTLSEIMPGESMGIILPPGNPWYI